MEASLHNIFSLLDGLVEISSKEETEHIVNKYFKDKLDAIN